MAHYTRHALEAARNAAAPSGIPQHADIVIVGAGMSGGYGYVLDLDRSLVNPERSEDVAGLSAEQEAEQKCRDHPLPQRDREPASDDCHGQVPAGGMWASALPAAAPVSAPLSTAATPLTSTVRTPAASRVGCS